MPERDRYEMVPVAESRRRTYTVSEECIESTRDFMRRHPPLSKQRFWYGAIKLLVLDMIGAELEFYWNGRKIIKPAGERFPPRPDDLPTGAPMDDLAEDRGPIGAIAVRLPPDLDEDLKDAVAWQREKFGTLSYAVEEAARVHMRRSVNEVMRP